MRRIPGPVVGDQLSQAAGSGGKHIDAPAEAGLGWECTGGQLATNSNFSSQEYREHCQAILDPLRVAFPWRTSFSLLLFGVWKGTRSGGHVLLVGGFQAWGELLIVRSFDRFPQRVSNLTEQQSHRAGGAGP